MISTLRRVPKLRPLVWVIPWGLLSGLLLTLVLLGFMNSKVLPGCTQTVYGRRRSRVRKEAFTATKARAAGLNREQVREAYLEELHARNLKIPPDPILKVAVDSIMGNPLPAARLLGQHLTAMGKEIHKLTKLFTQGH
jgi:hypothetical protein